MTKKFTHDSGDEGDGVLGGEECEEPGGCVVERSNLVYSQVTVEGGQDVMKETRQLVQSYLHRERETGGNILYIQSEI